jgi:hypothetical protein
MIIGAGKALYRLEQDDELRVGVLHGTGPPARISAWE